MFTSLDYMTFAIGASMFGFGVGGVFPCTGPWWAKPLAVIDLARCPASRHVSNSNSRCALCGLILT